MSEHKRYSKKAYEFPKVSSLKGENALPEFDKDEILEKKLAIEQAFRKLGVEGAIKNYYPGPVVTTYEFFPKPRTKSAKILNTAEALSCIIGSESIRIQRIPAKSSFGVEIPNNMREVISLSDLLESRAFSNSRSKLTFAIGKTARGEVYVSDLRTMPHLLVAGDTGTGKSILLHNLIASLLFKASPDEVKLILIDPRRFEFSQYDNVPHLLIPIITDPRKALAVLDEVVKIMEERYAFLSEHKVRNIEQYNDHIASKRRGKNGKPLPYVVIIVDEFAELSLTSKQDIDFYIARLGALAKPVGIHLVFATQRLSIDVISGTIKNNFPSRISFRVRSKIDSRLILDTSGAEKLLGMGDMLFTPPPSFRPIRLHGSYISIAKIRRLVNYLKAQGAPRYDERIASILQGMGKADDNEVEKDNLYDTAVHLILTTGHASASFLQRKLKMGFPRAARIIDEMEMEGLISPSEGSKPREILADAKDRLKE